MTFQYIINHLHEPHLACIILTALHAELNIQRNWNNKGLSLMFQRFQFGAVGPDV